MDPLHIQGYQVIRRLSAERDIFLARNGSSDVVLLKKVCRAVDMIGKEGTRYKSMAWNEISVNRLVSGREGFPQLIEQFDDRMGHKWMVMEYIHGQDLLNALSEDSAFQLVEQDANVAFLQAIDQDLIKQKSSELLRTSSSDSDMGVVKQSISPRIPEPTIRSIARQLVSRITFLHTLRIAHRDIKPDNVIIGDNGTVYLIDFGLSCIFKEGFFVHESVGTLHYAAPEVLDSDPYEPPAVDIWGLGVTLYVLVYGRLPFGNGIENPTKVIRSILHKEPKYPANVEISAELVDLMKRLLNKVPYDRISLIDIEKHPWMTGLRLSGEKLVQSARIPESIPEIELIITGGSCSSDIEDSAGSQKHRVGLKDRVKKKLTKKEKQ